MESLIANVLREMGVEPDKPAKWKPHIHKVINQTTREVIETMQDGYICSKCGKYSWTKRNLCDGCGSQMPIE